MLKRRYWKVKALIDEYPRSFWTLVIAVFIDRLGGSILFPFFTLYLTRKFDVGMTTVGSSLGSSPLRALSGARSAVR